MNSRSSSLKSKEKLKKTKNAKSKNPSSVLKSGQSVALKPNKNEEHKGTFSAEYSAEKATSSLDKCAVLLANILGNDVSDKILSISFGKDDCYSSSSKEETGKKFSNMSTPPRVVEKGNHTSESVLRVSKLEERLKRSGCFGNSSLSNMNSQSSVVVPTALNNAATEEAAPAIGCATYSLSSSSFSSKLKSIFEDGVPGAAGDIKASNHSVSEHEMSTISQVLLTPKVSDWMKPGMHNANDLTSKAPLQVSYETVLRSESLATSTPRHNRSLDFENEDMNEPTTANRQTISKETQDGRNEDVLTRELELPSAAKPSEILDGNQKDSYPFSSNHDPDDDRSTILLLNTLNQDKNLTLEQKLGLIATAGQVSMMNSAEKSDISAGEKKLATTEKSKVDVNEVLMETLSKLSAETSSASRKNQIPQFPSKDEVFSKSNLYDSNVLRHRKLSAINEHLSVVNDVFSDLKQIAGRKADPTLNEAIEELENAISVMPGMIDKKIFDNELKFTVEPLQEKVILVEGELAETRARLEAMEKLHKESMENRQKEVSSLKDSFNQQLAAEKLNCNKLKSAKFSLEKDNEKLENEVKTVHDQLKCQQMKLEKCSTGFTEEIREIRVEISAALNEVQKQKAKLGVAERQNEELNWSVEAKTEEVRTLEELAKKQHENINELVKELSILRSSLQQQKMLSDTLALEVNSLMSERNKFAVEAAKIRQSFDFAGLPNVSIAGTNFGKYPIPVPYLSNAGSRNLSSISRKPNVSDRVNFQPNTNQIAGSYFGDEENGSQPSNHLNGFYSQMVVQRMPKIVQNEVKSSSRLSKEPRIPPNDSDFTTKNDECSVNNLSQHLDSFLPHTSTEHIVAHAANINFNSHPFLKELESPNKQSLDSQNGGNLFQASLSDANNLKIGNSPKKLEGVSNAGNEEQVSAVNDHADDYVPRDGDWVPESVGNLSMQPNKEIVASTSSAVIQQELPASGRSVGSNSSSGTSHLVEFDLSFDTNSYSNFHIDSSQNTPRNAVDWESDVLKNSNLMYAPGTEVGSPYKNIGNCQQHFGISQKNGVLHGFYHMKCLPSTSTSTTGYLTNNQTSNADKVNLKADIYDNAFTGAPRFSNISSNSSNSADSVKATSERENTTESLTNVTVPTACANTTHHQTMGNLVYSRSVPPLDFSSLSNSSSALPSARSESKFQEGIKMLDADIQKLQNSIQQLFAVGQRD